MGNPADPLDYFNSEIYTKDKAIYQKYKNDIAGLSPDEKERRKIILESTIEDINEAYKMPVIIFGFLSALITFFSTLIKNEAIFYTTLGIYYTFAIVILIILIGKQGKKKILYGFYYSILLDIMKPTNAINNNNNKEIKNNNIPYNCSKKPKKNNNKPT